MQRVIVLPLIGPGMKPVQALRRKFDPLADHIPPHITLVFPFESDLSIVDVEAHIREVTAGSGAIHVHLADITGSEGEYLFLNVKRGNDALIGLRDRLYGGPIRPYRSIHHTYVPHVTVGHVSDPAMFEAALAEVAGMTETIDVVAREIVVYRAEAGSLPVESRCKLHT